MNNIITQFKEQINEILKDNGFGNIETETDNTQTDPADTEPAPTTVTEEPDPKTTQEPTEPDKQQQKVAPELTQEQKLQKVNALRENYENMKDIETSFENRTLGATGMATIGIGGMQLTTALSQDKADSAAEQQMKAYLETFTCNYAAGKNIKGGTTNIQLPGGNELINLYSEYVGLANDLKTRKNALGLRAGIESEPILDSATSGLYDDISVGKTSGAFTSLARALSDPNGTDAAAWAAQRAETAQKKDTALKTIGIGAVATVAGNLLINYNNEEEHSAEIIQKYENLKLALDNVGIEIKNTATQNSIPTAKECTENEYIGGNSGECIECGEDQRVNADKSGCESVNVVETKAQNDEITEECEYPRTLSSEGECKCGNSTIEVEGECKSIKEDFKTVISGFSADIAFDLGQKTLNNSAKEAIQNNKENIKKALDSYKDKTYCLYITGHTDRTGWGFCNGNNDCNKDKNIEFSKGRADAVLNELGLDSDNKVRARGVGPDKCDTDSHPKDNDPNCRKITFEIEEEECTDQ